MTRIDAPFLMEPGPQAVCGLLTHAGYQAWYVGGCVRNALLGLPTTDLDLTTNARPETVMKLAEAEGYDVREQTMSRESLYFADEIFFTGTAAEITPVRSVDGHVVRAGGRGPVAELMQERFFGLFSGETPDRHGWLQPVHDNAMEVQHVA